MALIAYERDIPATPNNPSVDQPDMKNNTNAIDQIIGIDHYSFNNNNSGWHKQTTMPIANPFVAPATAVDQGVFYTNTANGATNVFYKNDGVADQYQITRTNAANFATFGTNTNYAPVVVNQNGGWTFLPGGIILQYGSMVATGTSTTVVFPFAFPTALFSLNVSLRSNNRTYGFNNESTTGFDFSSSPSASQLFFWTAIGK